MPFEPLDTWASSYEETFSILFEDAAQPGFNSDAKTEEAWQTWYDGNIIDATCVAPIATAPTLTAVKDKLNFAPVQFVNPGTPDLAATVLSLAFAAYMNSLVWTPPPPAPPFSAITTVITDPVSVTAAQATLYAALLAEFAIIPPPGGDQAKYLAIGGLFLAASQACLVNFIGLSTAVPPAPLIIPVPMV